MLRKYRLVTLLSLLFVVINTFGYYSLDEVREVYKTTGSLSSFSNDVGEINENETSLEEKKKEVLNSYNKIVQSYYDFFVEIQKIVDSLCSDLKRTAEGLEPSIYSIKDKITNANINDAKKDDYFHKVDSIESELHEVVNNTSDLVFILKQVESFEKKLKTPEYYQEALESATTLKDIENVAEQVAELDKTLSELVPYIQQTIDEWDKFIQNKLKDISEYLRKMNEDSALQTVSGKCGENLTWAYDVDTQTLTISGTGDMVNYLSEIGAPWLPYKDRILRVIINEGVTGIGNYAFYNCSNLTSVISKIVNPFKISNSVFSNIGSNAILTVPSGTKSKYQATNYWNKFTNIVEESASDASDSEGWKLIDDNFDKSIPIKKIRVKNVKSTSASYCCIFFSTKANDNTTEDTNYNINFYNRTIGDNRSQGSGVQISSCTNVGDNWYEYEFKQTVYFSHYQSNSPRDQVLAFVSNSSDTSSPKRTIHVATAGTLPNLISESEKYTIEELTLTGELNGTDFRLLRDMAGNNYLGQDTEGKLKVLDLSEVTIVYGGEHYVATNSLADWNGQFRYTVWKSDEMPRHVFHGCKLKEVHMPNTLKSILDGAFARCKELTSVIILNNVTSIENDVFNGCTGLTSITIPNSVTSMGSSVFYGCSGLTSISIPNSVTSIGSSVFYGCGSLTSVSIPNSVSSIETDSFRDCSNLSTITIPNSVTSIGDFAFYQCNNLTSITIPNSVTSIGNSVFYGCNSLASIKVESGNTSYDSRNGCNAIIETATNTLIVGCMNTTIPNDILSIGSHAFRGCTGIKSMIIPSKVTYIGDYAFRDCSNLSSIEIPKSVTSIGNGAFCYCSSLSSITLPRDMTSIGSSAFYGCKNMYSILSEIIEPFEIEESVFWNIGSNATLTVPKGTKSKYQATNYWNKFTNIVESESQPDDNLSKVADAVDLGLSVKWASWNIGASKPEEYGSYFSWGETSPKTNYAWSTYKFGNPPSKYNSTDGKSSLDSSDDAAKVLWGGKWRMPTNEEEKELYEKCTWTYASINGINGYKVKGPNGNEIFLPFAGLYDANSRLSSKNSGGWYWSSSVHSNTCALGLYLLNSTVSYTVGSHDKCDGHVIRPVYEEETSHQDVKDVTFVSSKVTYNGIVSSKTAEVKSVNAGVTDLEIPSSVSYDGTTYQVTSIADDALSNRTFNYVSLPSTVKSVSSSTFYSSKLGALIWNASASLSSSVFSNMGMPVNSNFLLYVNSSSYAPSNVKNVVVNSSAQTILLSDDGGDFYCPKAFTAQSISYTHNYSMTTGGSGKGWETLALPFDVQNIEHKTKGTLTPFVLYDTNSSSQRPFWLYELGSNGFRRSEGIKANTPYIISMPNSTSYDSEYILTGDVTFSASSVQVRASNSVTAPVSGSKRFVPAFSSVARSSSVYALNVSNQKVSNSSSYDSGSRFISNLRSVYPFEAYMTTSSSGARMLNIGIEFEDDATDIDIIPSANGEQGVVKVYSLNGTLVLQTDRESLQKQWEPLPAGIYIVNGKKMVK